MTTKEIKKEFYNQTPENSKINHRWWDADTDKVYADLFRLVESIQQRQQYRRIQNVRNLRFYQNIEFMGLYNTMAGTDTSKPIGSQNIALNVIKSCVDTASSKIASMRPRPMFLTDGGNWAQRKRAEKLNKYNDGAFDLMKIYEKKSDSFTDCGIFGTGALKFFINYDRKRVECERVLIDEIIVDDAASIYGTPRELYQVRYVNRDLLKKMFPKKEMEISAASGWQYGNASEAAQDLIPVVEAWHLPTSSTSKDGMRAMVISSADLCSESWDYDWFPFVWDKWTKKRIGFYGLGIAEELCSLQLEINKILRTIQMSQHLMCVPRVWIDTRSSVNSQHFSNEIGAIGKYTGSAPIVTTSPGASPELYQHLENLYQKAYEITGISQLSANSQKPAGLDSGRALREFSDIESERFALTSRWYEQSFLDCTRIHVALTRDLAKSVPNLSIKVENGHAVDEIAWKDVDLKDDEYTMRLFPTSLLPTQPAGKLQTIQEMMQAGLIDQDMGTELLDFPDLKAAMRLRNSNTNLVLKILDKIVEKNEYEAPEAFMQFPETLKIAQSYYLSAKNDGVPEEQLDLLRTFITDCSTLMSAAAAPAPGAPADPLTSGMPPDPNAPIDPMAQPEAAPVSDLLPTAV